MPVRAIHLAPAEMPDALRRRAERLLAEGAEIHAEADALEDRVMLEFAIDLIEDAVALFAEFDPDL
jgi:hypothetical protein